ncbi:RusA family crossover junction endodeoxyribonuclease [Clostridium paraputrificum]|uniref:RusA family crossover junction endodeoxyribonuclease n=1 Tax=Clostridium TaxID=1485 RepID=UPI003D331AA5
MSSYAKVIVAGSPITKSNFKLHNTQGRAILPSNSGQYHDRYAIYEQEIAYIARSQNPDVVLEESLIALLKVYYKSDKRHPDTINITKSIFDGIEKSGLIVNDAQIRRIVVEEYYDKENPRFELELFGESQYNISYTIQKNEIENDKIMYSPIKKGPLGKVQKDNLAHSTSANKTCSICNKFLSSDNFVTGDKGKTLICKNCFKKLF